MGTSSSVFTTFVSSPVRKKSKTFLKDKICLVVFCCEFVLSQDIRSFELINKSCTTWNEITAQNYQMKHENKL
jgi:hypothetical protein